MILEMFPVYWDCEFQQGKEFTRCQIRGNSFLLGTRIHYRLLYQQEILQSYYLGRYNLRDRDCKSLFQNETVQASISYSYQQLNLYCKVARTSILPDRIYLRCIFEDLHYRISNKNLKDKEFLTSFQGILMLADHYQQFCTNIPQDTVVAKLINCRNSYPNIKQDYSLLFHNNNHLGKVYNHYDYLILLNYTFLQSMVFPCLLQLHNNIQRYTFWFAYLKYLEYCKRTQQGKEYNQPNIYQQLNSLLRLVNLSVQKPGSFWIHLLNNRNQVDNHFAISHYTTSLEDK